jgi:hypothetical protein
MYGSYISFPHSYPIHIPLKSSFSHGKTNENCGPVLPSGSLLSQATAPLLLSRVDVVSEAQTCAEPDASAGPCPVKMRRITGMSCHVIPCHTRFFDVPLHHSAAVSFNPFLHFFCGLLLPKDDSRTSKTVDEDNGAIMRNLTFLAQLHQLQCSVMFCVNSCNCHLRCDWTVFLPT